MLKQISTLTVALSLAALMASAAETGNRKNTPTNKLSPPAETSMKLGAQTVTIEYNAPSVKGRKVEGGLVPYDKVWRLGADSATTLTTTADVMIGDLKVPKGVHTLYIWATPAGWKLAVNKQVGQWGTEYSATQDLGRVDMKVTKSPSPIETLKINLMSTDAKSGMLHIDWGATQAVVPIKLI